MKKPGFNGCVYDFSADYDATNVDGIEDFHKYFIKKKIWYKWKYLDLLKKCFLLNEQVS